MKYGDIPQEPLRKMVWADTLGATMRLLVRAMKTLVSALGEAMGVEREGVH